MNKYGQFNFIATGISFAGITISVIKGNIWLFFLNAFICGINAYVGYLLVKNVDKK